MCKYELSEHSGLNTTDYTINFWSCNYSNKKTDTVLIHLRKSDLHFNPLILPMVTEIDYVLINAWEN